MGLSTALYTGVSGLQANGTGLSIIGDNIANTNTTGFKGNRAAFGDILSSSMGGGSSMQIGRGVNLQAVQTQFTQGTLETTSNPLDLAIEGDGFFIVKTEAQSGAGAQYYTRAGNFKLNKDGFIVTPENMFLQGYLTSAGGALGTINVSSLNSQAKSTGSISISANLSSGTKVKHITTGGESFSIDSTNNVIYAKSATVNSSNNQVQWTDGVTTYTATLADGTYGGAALAQALQNAINTPGSNLPAAPPSNAAITVAYDPATDKFQITNPTGTAVPVTIQWTAAPTTAENIFGFTSTSTLTSDGSTSTANNTSGLVGSNIFLYAQSATVTGANNSVRFIATTLGVPTTYDISIPAGVYDGDGLATALQTQMNASMGGTGVTVTYNATTDAFTITNNAGVPDDVDILWTNANTTAKNIYGFTTDSNLVGGGTSKSSDTTIDLFQTAVNKEGTYTGAQLASELQKRLNAAFGGSASTVSYSTTTNTYTITNPTGGTNGYDIDWRNINNSMEQVLGFNSTTYSDLKDGNTISSDNTSATGFDPTDPVTTSDFSTSVTSFDSLGNSHLITIYFRKTSESSPINSVPTGQTGNRWDWYAVVPKSDASTPAHTDSYVAGHGSLEFDTAGRLQKASQGLNGFDFSGGVTQGQQINFGFGTSITLGGSGLDGTTQFGTPNSVLFQNQDGFTAGSLQSLIVDQNGTMTGVFTNGQTSKVADVGLARFIAPTELTKAGRNLYNESNGSGVPIIGTAGTSGRGRIFANSLEASNVDLAEEFVKMISAQRGFQANTKVITATDQLLQELGNIKQ